MSADRYTLGYDAAALAFVGRRTLQSHGAFFIEHLRDGMQVLDVGCGPGSITSGIATRIGSGSVTGVDLSESQVTLAKQSAAKQGIANARFRVGSAYELPFAEAQFDAVFSHALLEHLREPVRAMREFLRVLKPSGVMGVATPDWSAFVYGPSSPALVAAVKAYEALQVANGGDVNVGHKLSQYAVDAGFAEVKQQARYENFEPLSIITDVLAAKLEQAGHMEHAGTLREFERTPHAMFAEAWVSCVGYRPQHA
ncbi:MAG: methyltransferase domain-containing protein [Betaproteobacteria bacterium]|nr:MAG: methyltransferase domain-containing protein [Betaproteobacteria bacterium]